MQWNEISGPRRYEDLDLRVNDVEYSEISGTEFYDIIAEISGDGDLGYAIWYQEDGGELQVLEVSISYKDGEIVSYDEALVDE